MQSLKLAPKPLSKAAQIRAGSSAKTCASSTDSLQAMLSVCLIFRKNWSHFIRISLSVKAPLLLLLFSRLPGQFRFYSSPSAIRAVAALSQVSRSPAATPLALLHFHQRLQVNTYPYSES